jgi:hypothetical protein
MPKKSDSQRVAQAFGYTPEELQSIPAEAHLGLSCGNPVAAATLREVGKVEFTCPPHKCDIFSGRDSA